LSFELSRVISKRRGKSRRREARILEDAIFQTKIELALGMIEEAVQASLLGSVVLADAAYGDSTTFRNTVRYLSNKDFAVGVGPNLKVVRLDCHDRPKGNAIAIGGLSPLVSPARTFASSPGAMGHGNP
jgi:SRSO17 transposase